MTKQSLNGYIPENCANIDNFPHIKGYDFNEKFNFDKFISAFSTTGLQATNIGHAIEIIKAMRREKATIFLSYTSNMVSSGVRDVIRYLAEHNLVDVLITTAGGIEEDFIKSIKPFVLGSFDANGRQLNEKGINRIGNILVTNDRYTYFEKEMNNVLDNAYKIQKSKNNPISASELAELMGKHINNKESILYWAYKNKIPIFCPAPTDGSLGDMMFFMKQKNKDFTVDTVEDLSKIIKIALNADKTGLIILGGGVAKHYALNAQIFREGCEFAVYINTANEFDGSDSGASPDEAVSWSKIKPNSPTVKVTCDASIAFPLIVASAFQKPKQ